VPIYHHSLVATLDWPQSVAVLNIGGVANVTYVDGNDPLLAFDIGSGNALLDDFMHVRTGEPWEEDDAAAQRGTADRTIIAQIRNHPFFALPPPKSLDRNAFAGLDLLAMTVGDGAATLTMLTVRGDHRGRAQPPAARALQLDRCRRRSPQSDADGEARRAACSGSGGPGDCDRLVHRCHGGASLPLFGRAHAEGGAHHLSGHHRRRAADARRRGPLRRRCCRGRL
jgi:hypothetical protein